jgi:hypothetical protein
MIRILLSSGGIFHFAAGEAVWGVKGLQHSSFFLSSLENTSGPRWAPHQSLIYTPHFIHALTICYFTPHGLINYIDTKAKCRHLKHWPVKGLGGRCLSEFIDWRYIVSHVGIFDPALWTVAPLTFSLVHSPPPSPLPCVKVQYIQTVCGWEGVGGVESCWRPYSAGVLQSVSDQIQNLQNC